MYLQKILISVFALLLVAMSHAAHAKFMSNDPVDSITHIKKGNTQGFNRYAYANNNPYKFVDPDGRTGVPFALTPFDKGIGPTGTQNLTLDERKLGAALVVSAALLVVPGPEDLMLAGAMSKLSRGAESSVNGVKLEKQLASESQLTQLAEGGGTVISHPARQADRIAAQTGKDAANIQKVSSDAHIAKDGSQVQTHAFRDASTNELIQPKTIINEDP